jgi:transcriptional regulator of NAD metabolism
MMQKMNGLKILSLDADAESQIMKSVVREMDQIVNSGEFESAVEARDKGERVNIYYRVSGSNNADMLIITREKTGFNCIWIKGNMTKEELMNSFSKGGDTIHIGFIDNFSSVDAV